MNEILKKIFKTGVLPNVDNIRYAYNIDNLFLKFDIEVIKDFLNQKEILLDLDGFKAWFLEDTSNEAWNNLKKVFLNNKRNYDMIMFNRYD
jgi:hypothetical protein